MGAVPEYTISDVFLVAVNLGVLLGILIAAVILREPRTPNAP